MRAEEAKEIIKAVVNTVIKDESDLDLWETMHYLYLEQQRIERVFFKRQEERKVRGE